MLKLLQASLMFTGVLVLSGCNIDESFSTDPTPAVYTTNSQVTTVNPSVGRSPSQPRYGSVNNTSNVVTTTQQSNVVAITPPSSMVSRSAPVVTQTTPVVTESVPVTVEEPAVRSTPDDVIGTYNG